MRCKKPSTSSAQGKSLQDQPLSAVRPARVMWRDSPVGAAGGVGVSSATVGDGGGVLVIVGVCVAVAVGVFVGVKVAVGVYVAVGVGVSVGVLLGVNDAVGV